MLIIKGEVRNADQVHFFQHSFLCASHGTVQIQEIWIMQCAKHH